MESYTLEAPVTFDGVGIHSGVRSSVTISPAERPGIVWLGRDGETTPLGPGNYSYSRKTSTLGVDGVSIGCPEHVFGALALLNIRSARISTTGTVEFPAYPDSSASFYELLDPLTRPHVDADDGRDPDRPRLEPLEIRETRRLYQVTPAERFSCEVEIDGPHGALGRASISESQLADRGSPVKIRLARSRTWIRREDQDALLRAGLCKGIAATPGCRVLAEHELKDEAVLAECAAHKLYDLLGDLFLLGAWPRARIFARNPGHRLNSALLTFLSAPVAASIQKQR